MRISDWSSDVCSSGLAAGLARRLSGNHFIDGRLVAAVSGETFSVVNPATGLEVGRAANGTGADVNAAVDAAAKAQKQWARMPARARGKLLNECAVLLQQQAEEITQIGSASGRESVCQYV